MSAVEVDDGVVELFDENYDECLLSLFDGTIITQSEEKVKLSFHSRSPNNISP